MIRVLIADDQALVRAGLSALLQAETDLEVVGAASDGVEALALARELQPDIACLDIRMPGMDGIEVARQLCGPGVEHPIPVLVLTTFDLDDYVFGALEAGASGFLLKDADPVTIVRAVHQVAAGQGTIDQALTRRVLREFVNRRRLQPVTAGRAGELLTPPGARHPAAAGPGDVERGHRGRAHRRGLDGEVPPGPAAAQARRTVAAAGCGVGLPERRGHRPGAVIWRPRRASKAPRPCRTPNRPAAPLATGATPWPGCS